MDARAAESRLTNRLDGWLQRERESGRFYDRLTVIAAAVLVGMLIVSFVLLGRTTKPSSLLSPPMIALLLIANLIPAIAVMVLLSRKVAMARAGEGGLGSGRLHTRLVALFSVVAAAPTVVVAIFASLLMQSGFEFWFSDRARSMLENTVQVAKLSYQQEADRVSRETITMSGDLSGYLKQLPVDSPQFIDLFGRQVLIRNLSEAIIVNVGDDGLPRGLVLINPYDRPLDKLVTAERIAQLKGRESVIVNSSDRIGALVRLDYGPKTYLYAARVFDPQFQQQLDRANGVLNDYQALLAKSRNNQLKFNIALLIGALLIVALAIAAALKIADRLVRPVGQLAEAAGRIEAGDFSTRVEVTETEDEIEMLASAFNRMTGKLEEQTSALKAANTQLDTRRAFIEAVLSSVTAGVIALDAVNRVLLVNRTAEGLIEGKKPKTVDGMALAKLSPELDEFMQGDQSEANVLVTLDGSQRTLAVKRVRYSDGSVITFDDITDQLSDQRRAAWSDIARRIAHEIKNPLTPIQLAAERLQRRFGKEIVGDKETFEKLTSTIVRQVADLRRMVDEFSNFARMPKPVFREENVHDIARQALFLHEVAHPALTFELEPPEGDFIMVCDRRQLAQALTNIVKNGVEAIEGRRYRGEHSLSGDRVELRLHKEGNALVIDVLDTGIGLPEDRERLTEPYMTTRVRGTGLGLAIVKKIVEEHMGEIAFLDRQGGGTHVRIAFDTDKLAALEQEGGEEPDDNDNNEPEDLA